MKRLLRIISIICVLTLTVCILPVVSVRAEDKVAIIVESASSVMSAGETVTFTVKVENNPGVWSISFSVPINDKIFDFVGIDTENCIFDQLGMCGYDESSKLFKFNAYSADLFSNVNDDGILVAITLKIKDNVETGEYYLSAIPDDENIINVSEEFVKIDPFFYFMNIKGAEPDPQSKIVAADVVLGKTVDVNYYVKIDNTHTSAKMKFTVNGSETIVSGVPTVEYEGEYVYTLENLKYEDFDKNIKAELILGEQILDVKDDYSIKKYCERMKNKSSSELGIGSEQNDSLKKLLYALIEYGECLVSSCNTDEIRTFATNYRAALSQYARK